MELLRGPRRPRRPRSRRVHASGGGPVPDGGGPRPVGTTSRSPSSRSRPRHRAGTQIIEEESCAMTSFAIECFQNGFLPLGADTMHAVLTVTASGSAGGRASPAWPPRTDPSCSSSTRRDPCAAPTSAVATQADPRPPSTASQTGCHSGSSAGTTRRRWSIPSTGSLAVASPKTRPGGEGSHEDARGRGWHGHGLVAPPGHGGPPRTGRASVTPSS